MKHLRGRKMTAFFMTVVMLCSILSVFIDSEKGIIVANAADTVYLEDQLLYWRVEDGSEAPTIKLRTSDLPINFTYTTPLKQEAIPADIPAGQASTYFSDVNPGSVKSYGDTLLAAGVVESIGSDATEVLIHKDRIEPTNKDLYKQWGRRVISWKAGSPLSTPYSEDDYNGDPVYCYDGHINDSELTSRYPEYAYNECVLPNLLTEAGMLSYKVAYEGNAILVPKVPLTYYTDVQGKIVEVTSDKDVKLMYAVETPKVSPEKVKWILGTNTTTVRLEAEYSYTKLVPITDGKYEEGKFNGTKNLVTNYPITYGDYGRSVSNDNDTSIPVYNDGTVQSYNDYGSFMITFPERMLMLFPTVLYRQLKKQSFTIWM